MSSHEASWLEDCVQMSSYPSLPYLLMLSEDWLFLSASWAILAAWIYRVLLPTPTSLRDLFPSKDQIYCPQKSMERLLPTSVGIGWGPKSCCKGFICMTLRDQFTFPIFFSSRPETGREIYTYCNAMWDVPQAQNELRVMSLQWQ